MNRAAHAALALAGAASLGAAQTIPVRQLGPVTAQTTERFGTVAGVWQFSNGHVLVNDGLGARLLMFDSALTRGAVIADSNTTIKYTRKAAPLIPFASDSVLFVEINGPAMVFVMIGPDGTVARSLAPPTPARDANVEELLIPAKKTPIGRHNG